MGKGGWVKHNIEKVKNIELVLGVYNHLCIREYSIYISSLKISVLKVILPW